MTKTAARRPAATPDANLLRDAQALHAALAHLVRVYQFQKPVSGTLLRLWK